MLDKALSGEAMAPFVIIKNNKKLKCLNQKNRFLTYSTLTWLCFFRLVSQLNQKKLKAESKLHNIYLIKNLKLCTDHP